MLPRDSRNLLLALVGLSVVGAAYTAWLQLEFFQARTKAEQASRLASEEHIEAERARARAEMLEAERPKLLAQLDAATKDAAKWKREAMRKDLPPTIPDTEAGVVSAWVLAGFRETRGTGQEAVWQGLGDSKRALGVVLEAPGVARQLDAALQTISFTEQRAGAAEAGWANEQKVSGQWKVAAQRFEGEAGQWKVVAKENEKALKVERRFGKIKVAGAVVLTAWIVDRLHK